MTTLVEGRKAAGLDQRKITYALDLGTIHNEATIIRLAAQGHTNEAIATLLDTTEGTIKNRRQRIRRWLTALVKQNGVADLVETWNKSGGDQKRAVRIQGAYRNGQKSRVAHATLSSPVDPTASKMTSPWIVSRTRQFFHRTQGHDPLLVGLDSKPL